MRFDARVKYLFQHVCVSVRLTLSRAVTVFMLCARRGCDCTRGLACPADAHGGMGNAFTALTSRHAGRIDIHCHYTGSMR